MPDTGYRVAAQGKVWAVLTADVAGQSKTAQLIHGIVSQIEQNETIFFIRSLFELITVGPYVASDSTVQCDCDL